MRPLAGYTRTAQCSSALLDQFAVGRDREPLVVDALAVQVTGDLVPHVVIERPLSVDGLRALADLGDEVPVRAVLGLHCGLRGERGPDGDAVGVARAGLVL